MNDNQRQVTQQEAECQLYLIQNPGYDSDWVGEASKILNIDVSVLYHGLWGHNQFIHSFIFIP